MLEGGRESWRTPPPLQEARVGPQLPHVGDGRLERRSDDHRLPRVRRHSKRNDSLPGLCVLVDIPNGHSSFFPVVSLRTFSKRSRRAATALRVHRAVRAPWRSRLTSPRTSCSRPLRCLETRPASTSTSTCFCTAVRLIGYSRPSSLTERSRSSVCVTMSRRVASLSAKQPVGPFLALESFYNHLVVDYTSRRRCQSAAPCGGSTGANGPADCHHDSPTMSAHCRNTPTASIGAVSTTLQSAIPDFATPTTSAIPDSLRQRHDADLWLRQR